MREHVSPQTSSFMGQKPSGSRSFSEDSGELDERAFPSQKEILKVLPIKVNWLSVSGSTLLKVGMSLMIG